MTFRYMRIVSLAFLFLVAARVAFAHAILVRSTPADHAVVNSRNVDLTLDYNSRIDVSRSTLTLTGPAGKSLPVRMQSSTKPSELKALAGNLASGTYSIHWQVLASDGHITRGEISFTVAGSSPR